MVGFHVLQGVEEVNDDIGICISKVRGVSVYSAAVCILWDDQSDNIMRYHAKSSAAQTRFTTLLSRHD
ncbi:hypothetical protein SAMN05192552_101666 [Natrinema hispanicum]|uniref:Uncharacterized protein n=1 Tax=Natrinema hispanicum TaxID=392421 RepID=A0A1I0K031_9EURY|nr:hypothetical protein SAMN05192552_101666 [Natrinema hispanicum]SEU15945.1 hypothetical protein SAMN04488694_1912 [Natrinema hispanicum]